MIHWITQRASPSFFIVSFKIWHCDCGADFVFRIADAASLFIVSRLLCDLDVDLSAKSLCANRKENSEILCYLWQQFGI